MFEVMKTKIALTLVSSLFVGAVGAFADDAPPADLVPYAGLSPEDAAKFATLPPGFKMHVFAGEPDILQPIAFCLDHRGRLWVAEGLTYPRRQGNPPASGPRPSRAQQPSATGAPDPSGQHSSVGAAAGGRRAVQTTPEQLKDIFGGADRILVFEDTNGDHKFDKRTVFLEGLNLVSGLEYGFGGLWVGAAPYLMFIPIEDGNEPKPAGPPQILLDGWNYTTDTHETLNTFTWGPDGWLYGCHGVFCPSNVGKPGAPDSERQWCDAAVWRYHPTKDVFEIFAEGTSNPWGVDFDEYGQCWIEACVIPHLWHMIQGGRYERQGGEHYCINRDETARNEPYRDKGGRKPVFPFVYEDIKTVGDHVHYAGNKGPHAGNARSDVAGGGHAHAGMMVYLGESWPAEYRGKLFMGNIHGQRLNMDIPERSGSGYIGHHGKDFLNFNDTWSQTLNQLYDQDGSVYVIDWYDKNQCHHTREDGHDRSNGRIYKIVYNNQPTTKVDLQKLSDEELVKLQLNNNEFCVRHARRLLQERAATRTLDSTTRPALEAILRDNSDVIRKLRALWALHVTGGISRQTYVDNLKSRLEWLRAWTIQLPFEDRESVERILMGRINEKDEQLLKSDLSLNQLAASDPSPLVRLYLASVLQRLPVGDRADILPGLLQHAEDAYDHNLPMMYWYAAEGCVASHPDRALELLKVCKIPKVREFIARRLATMSLTK